MNALVLLLRSHLNSSKMIPHYNTHPHQDIHCIYHLLSFFPMAGFGVLNEKELWQHCLVQYVPFKQKTADWTNSHYILPRNQNATCCPGYVV